MLLPDLLSVLCCVCVQLEMHVLAFSAWPYPLPAQLIAEGRERTVQALPVRAEGGM